jgi:hypothetical protein
MTVTSGKQWRKRREEGVEIQFPTTGNVARIRPLDLEFFIEQGRLQNLLESAVFESLTEKEITAFTDEEMSAFNVTLGFLNQIVTHCFVLPKIVKDPTADDEISISDVTMDEKWFLFNLLVRPMQALDSFRPKQADNVGSVASSEVDSTASKPDSGDRGVGEPTDGDAGHVDSNPV